MKWISVKDKMPEDYNWVIVGHIDPDEGNTVYGIARYISRTGWQFFLEANSTKYIDSPCIDSPSCGDDYGIIYLSKITHWFEIDKLDELSLSKDV